MEGVQNGILGGEKFLNVLLEIQLFLCLGSLVCLAVGLILGIPGALRAALARCSRCPTARPCGSLPGCFLPWLWGKAGALALCVRDVYLKAFACLGLCFGLRLCRRLLGRSAAGLLVCTGAGSRRTGGTGTGGRALFAGSVFFIGRLLLFF